MTDIQGAKGSANKLKELEQEVGIFCIVCMLLKIGCLVVPRLKSCFNFSCAVEAV